MTGVPAVTTGERHRRVELGLKINLKLHDKEAFVERFSQNLSRSGIFIRASDPAPAGSRVHFEYRLADGTRVMRGMGIVRWVRSAVEAEEPEKPPGMGIEFVDLDADTEELIGRVVARFGEGSRAPRRQKVESAAPRASARPGGAGTDRGGRPIAPADESEFDSLLDHLSPGVKEVATKALAAPSTVRDLDATAQATDATSAASSDDADGGAALDALGALDTPGSAAAPTRGAAPSAAEIPSEVTATWEETTTLTTTVRVDAGGGAPTTTTTAEDAPAATTKTAEDAPAVDHESAAAEVARLAREVLSASPSTAPTEALAEAQAVPQAVVGASHSLIIDLSADTWRAHRAQTSADTPPCEAAWRIGERLVPSPATWLVSPGHSIEAQVVARRLGAKLTYTADAPPGLVLAEGEASALTLLRDALATLVGREPPSVARLLVASTLPPSARAVLTRELEALQVGTLQWRTSAESALEALGLDGQDSDHALVLELESIETRVTLLTGPHTIDAALGMLDAGLHEADRLLAQDLAVDLLRQHSLDAAEDPELLPAVQDQVCRARHHNADAAIAVSIAGMDVRLEKVRAAQLLVPLGERVALGIAQVLRRAGLAPSDLAVVLLAGHERPWPGLVACLERLLGTKIRVATTPPSRPAPDVAS